MKRLAVVLLTLLLTCGCARSGPQADQRSCADFSTASAFPYYSLQDWVTYGDHLITAQVRLTDEDGRVELVPTETLWSRPLAPTAPGPLRRWARRAGPQGIELKAGHTYLTLLFRWNPTGQAVEWGSMDVLAFDDGIVGQGPDQCWPAGSLPAREQLWGLDEAGVRQNLASTTPDPLAAPYANLAPDERYQRIAADRE
jgi:hypothetical protein